ncbi:aminotransferase class I/II-fold pyridoxal phosphate-dependent enzyme [Sphingomonas morindae]|uniref:Aminotransferase n=1 Tax=Sphingomonas morindae TaxID=1541170 RepID=A0ABY4XCA8_9SPHN|nr:aminotransferase class I/II-fold pyridoxal phosphate-dependent enzyme [Sphingomonas morindae]USI74315.1 aminotransferase class I/II-fold pyridoxal phosphate-dependent enzyme [Sphingomonas morindae]
MGAADLAPFLAHGGRVAAARAHFGGADWLDLSTGIAPWPYPVRPEDFAAEAARLPDPEALAALEAEAATRFGLGPEAEAEVVAVPGTDLALRLLPPLLPGRAPALLWPGYAGHRAAWPDAVRLTALAWRAAGGAHDLLICASPSNPGGERLDPGAAARLCASSHLMIDHAYADAPGEGLDALAGPRLTVLRSFGKMFGLPGLRLGFVLIDPPRAARLRHLLGDWPIATPTLAIADRAYRDQAWQAAQRDRIATAGAALDRLLDRLGLAHRPSPPLFRCLEQVDGAALFRHLAGHAILTRPFAARADWLRLGLPGDAAALARLAAALEEYRR